MHFSAFNNGAEAELCVFVLKLSPAWLVPYTTGSMPNISRTFRHQFDRVDKAADPDRFIEYLDAVRRTAFFREIKKRLLELMHLEVGQVAIDVGCGTGEDVLAIEASVGPGGCAVGVDISANMVAHAVNRARQQSSRAHFITADVEKLPFHNEQFNAVRAERLLQHSHDPYTAVKEMVRIIKPDGRLVIWEGDLDLLVIDAPDYDTSRIMQRFICDQFQNGSVGHRLYRMFLDAGLANVHSMPLAAEITDFDLIESAFDLSESATLAVERGLLESQRARLWIESLEQAGQLGRFFSAVGGFITCGTKP